MIPIISFIGYSNSGKTTLLTKVIKELKGMKLRVGTIKHHHGLLELDKPYSDTWSHYHSGADIVALATADRVFITKRIEQPSLDEVIECIKDVDIILIEGYKKASVPKIEILRQNVHSNIISPLNEIIAFATDWDNENSLLDSVEVPKFSVNDPYRIALFIKETFIN